MHPNPQFSAKYNPDFVHITPSLYYMRGETEDGEDAGLSITFAWLGLSLSVIFT